MGVILLAGEVSIRRQVNLRGGAFPGPERHPFASLKSYDDAPMSARKVAKPAKKSASLAKRPRSSKPSAAPGLTVITLGVSDLARSRRFYCDGLGFSPGGVVLALYPRDLLAKDAQLSPKGSGFGGVTVARNVGTKAEVDAALDAARAAGAKILKPAQEAFWGGYSGYFADPDSHPWEVAYNPHWKLDAEGRVVLPS
jgi:catechol 2,3-dioxygenase-like lactoylglutathione lyase family enzyme